MRLRWKGRHSLRVEVRRVLDLQRPQKEFAPQCSKLRKTSFCDPRMSLRCKVRHSLRVEVRRGLDSHIFSDPEFASQRSTYSFWHRDPRFRLNLRFASRFGIWKRRFSAAPSACATRSQRRRNCARASAPPRRPSQRQRQCHGSGRASDRARARASPRQCHRKCQGPWPCGFAIPERSSLPK